MADHDEPGKPVVAIGGVPIGTLFSTFQSDDDLVAELRKRASYIGLSYQIIEELAGMAEGAVGKYLAPVRARSLTTSSALKICEALGVKAVLIDGRRTPRDRTSRRRRALGLSADGVRGRVRVPQ
jgi:hypothetical protein